ncbi:ferritin-like domain-containing protein [Sorangium sp. So ce315]|uniref:ferritin-like domain-containing protein n=1 Tax=Sorangium sp. So ce315 TaxID=3133299 RepID=UPI003F645665
MRRRAKLVVIEVVGAVALLVPTQALASPEGSFNPGFLLSVGSGECAVGVGAELSGMYLPKGHPGSIGYGGFFQAQTYAGDYARMAFGFQLGSFVGAELGVAALSRSDNHASTFGLHTGVFASLAVLGTGVRVTIPMSSADADLPAHGVEASWVLTLKVPIYSGKVWTSHGRPLRGERGPVTAAAREASGWADISDAALVAHLSPREREELAALWLEAALVEHASIATFAALALELLSLGAPADLLAACQQAAQEEIEHARLCFGLASTYAGLPLGPGELPSPAAALSGDAAAVARLSFTDGCIGETFAAALARRAQSHATDPAVARVLARIATDEARHAALAWSVVAWCLKLDPVPVRAALGAALAAPELEAPAPLTDVQGLPIMPAARHGAVPVEEQKPLRRRAERTARARLKDMLRPPGEARILTARDAGTSPSA